MRRTMRRAWTILPVALTATPAHAADRLLPKRATVQPPEEAVRDVARFTRSPPIR